MVSVGYTTTKNAGFFFPRYMAIAALDIAFAAWKGRQFHSHPHYLAMLSVSTLGFSVWSHQQRAYARELGECELDGKLPQEQSSVYGIANAFATQHVWKTMGTAVTTVGAPYLIGRFAPQTFSRICLGIENGLVLAMSTVQLWHLCVKPKEVK